MLKIITLVLFLSNILLFGCASEPITNNLTWKQQQKSINNLTSWHATGKIGFNDGKHGGIATIDWQQTDDHFNIILYGPFKTDNVHIIGEPGKVKLGSSTGNIQIATTPEEIIKQQLGWNLPISGLISWSRGIPIKKTAVEFIQLSKENRLIKLKQQGWTINYYNYKAFSGFILPTKIILQYEKIRVKLIFNSWL